MIQDFKKMASELLPCNGWGCHTEVGVTHVFHDPKCPATFCSAVAAALAQVAGRRGDVEACVLSVGEHIAQVERKLAVVATALAILKAKDKK